MALTPADRLMQDVRRIYGINPDDMSIALHGAEMILQAMADDLDDADYDPREVRDEVERYRCQVERQRVDFKRPVKA